MNAQMQRRRARIIAVRRLMADRTAFYTTTGTLPPYTPTPAEPTLFDEEEA